MRRAAGTAIWAGVVVAALGGCGTVHNFVGDDADSGRCEVFGGVRSDVRTGFLFLRDPGKVSDDYPVQACAKAIGSYLLAVDLPLSAVGDTVTLPWTCLNLLWAKDAAPEPRRASGRKAPPTAEPAAAAPAAAGEEESP